MLRVVGGRLRFAERADEIADEDTEIEPQAIYNYLYFHVIPSPETIYKGFFACHQDIMPSLKMVSDRCTLLVTRIRQSLRAASFVT